VDAERPNFRDHAERSHEPSLIYRGKNFKEIAMSDMTKQTEENDAMIAVQRVQTGVRIEKRLLKALKALAEYFDITLGDLLEGIVLHAFEGKSPFTEPDVLQHIVDLKRIYGIDYDSSASHHFIEQEGTTHD
jgi:hypothetical protein